MAQSVTLRTLLANVPSLRALAQQLAADPRSDKTAEVWRGQLHYWKKTGRIGRDNAVILAEQLNVPIEQISPSPEQALAEEEDRYARLEERLADALTRIAALEAGRPGRATPERDGQ